MKSVYGILALAMLLAAVMAPAAEAGETVLAGFCMPLTSRFTKCIDGKVAECVRTRSMTCKTRETCKPADARCDLPALMPR